MSPTNTNRTARLVLTFREDLVPVLQDFYLGGKRTEFLVIAYNADTINPKRIASRVGCALLPYRGISVWPEDPPSISGIQYRVWIDAAKHFPEVSAWVIHDYDFLARPSDAEIISHISENQYGMIGKAFPVWQEGMSETNVDTYPFPQSHRYWHKVGAGPIDMEVDSMLMENFPCTFQGVKTLMGGYSDFVATARKNILLLDNALTAHLRGGLEQVPHSIWKAKGLVPVDMRQFFKLKVVIDEAYLPISPQYDMINPVKFWPNEKIDMSSRIKNAKLKSKKLVKRIIGYEGWQGR